MELFGSGERKVVKHNIRKAYPNAYLYEFKQFKARYGLKIYNYAIQLIRKYNPTSGRNVGVTGYINNNEKYLQGIFFYVYNLDGSTTNTWQELSRIEDEIIFKLKIYCLKNNLIEWR